MTYDTLWKIHAVLMSTSFAALLSGILITRYFKKKKWRYKTHKKLGILAGITAVAGLITAVINVQISSGLHLSSPHTIAGTVVGLILIFTPIVGLSIRKAKKKKATRLLHRTMGYTTLILVTLTILSGLILTGILRLPFPVSGITEKNTQNNSEATRISELGDNEVLVGDIFFSWKIENGFLEGTLKSPGKGWVAVGFNPQNLMEGADFVIAYVDEGEVFLRDDYGSWYTSHDSDVSLGGLEDVEILDGSQDENGTVIRFRKPLDSGDEFDHVFTPGEEIPVIFAYSDKNSFTGMHLKKGKTRIRF